MDTEHCGKALDWGKLDKRAPVEYVSHLQYLMIHF
jgi:hypothetical protein